MGPLELSINVLLNLHECPIYDDTLSLDCIVYSTSSTITYDGWDAKTGNECATGE
jgi:hypothetical protein